MCEWVLDLVIGVCVDVALIIASSNGLFSLPTCALIPVLAVAFLCSVGIARLRGREARQFKNDLKYIRNKLDTTQTSQTITATAMILNPWLEARNFADDLYGFIKDRLGAKTK